MSPATNRLSQISTTPEAEIHAEGCLARTIEEQTAKLPSDLWLWASLGSMGASLFFQYQGRRNEALFVGQWAAPLLLLGVYNKLVKIAGSDRIQR